MNQLNDRLALHVQVRESFDGPPIAIVDRIVRFHQSWESVRYKGRRYRLFGTIIGPLFIDLSKER